MFVDYTFKIITTFSRVQPVEYIGSGNDQWSNLTDMDKSHIWIHQKTIYLQHNESHDNRADILLTIWQYNVLIYCVMFDK